MITCAIIDGTIGWLLDVALSMGIRRPAKSVIYVAFAAQQC